MKINFENVPIYGMFIIIAITLNCVIAYILGKFQKMEKRMILGSLIYESIGMILGAKILNMIQIKENKSIFYAGFSAYGGVIGSIFFLVVFSKIYKADIKKILNMYISLLPLLYAVSKLGCFFMGCCYGIEYSGIGNVVYLNSKHERYNIALLPIQLIESIFNFAIFIYIMIIYKRNYHNNQIIGIVFILCGISKFVLEFFRATWNYKITLTQIISLIFVILGLVILNSERKYIKKQNVTKM